MRFANPAGLWLLTLAVPILLLHMLRPRRPSVEVSSTYLWREVSRPVSAAVPWQPLRPSTLLVLQLVALLLLATAAARPVRETAAPLAQHSVFILDASASMRATDHDPDRLERARREALNLRGQLPDGGLASVVVASSQPVVRLSASADATAFAEAVRAVRPGGGSADWPQAFALAESLETPGVPIGFVLLSDGNLTAAEQRLIPPGTRYVRIGGSGHNQAVSALSLTRRGTGLVATVGIRNTGPRDQPRVLRLDVDGRTQATAVVPVPAGGVAERRFELPDGERVVALLEGDDFLPFDDRAFAVAAPRPDLRVLYAGPPNVFWEGLLEAVPGVRVERSQTSRSAHGFDAALYVGVPVPEDPGAPALAVASPGGAPGVRVSGEVDEPVLAFVRGADPLFDGLDLSEVAIARAQRIEAPTDEVLLAAEGAPLLVRGTRWGRPFVYLAFAVEDSNLGVQVAFPVLGDRLVGELTRAALPPGDIRTGATLPLEGPAEVTVTGPGGFRQAVAAGDRPPVADRPGFWTARDAAGTERTIAVNPAPRESFIEPAASLPVRPRPRRPGERPPAGEASLLPWWLAALGLVGGAELWLSRRRSGVPRSQWRAALVVRGVIAASLVAALAGLSVPRPGSEVAVVFAVDASDSMGHAGRAEALAWVREALDAQPRRTRAGVVLFGGDARLELAVRPGAELGQPGARVDASRTNLAAALRLAGAVQPSDARRRVVLVSDGRPTEGDAEAEAERLREAGIRVDVRPMTPRAGADAAVLRLDAPQTVREGEALALRATVASTVEQALRLTLRRDGDVVQERSVEVRPGEHVVEIGDMAGGPGVYRYRIELTASEDAVPENNIGHAAVRVLGPARTLLVEGSAGAGADLARALEAGGLTVDVVDPSAIPPLDTLAAYEATTLVDVEARALTDDQVRILGSAVRELGRGLVVVGGDRSFSVGGYLGTELERLLPVESDVTDPKRRPSVAQVLAIDTSGSMGACHCDPRRPSGFGGDRGEGGINKTDISRAAAARAIRALRQSDWVGVLAFNTEHRWVVPLAQLPADEVIERGLRRLNPSGGTRLGQPLNAAAEELLAANRQLKHIILFTDGWTNEEGLVAQAEAIAAQGMTISVLATGEGPGEELRRIAEAGRGRFYPGTDLNDIPRLMMEEVTLASRQFVNEGEFFPTVRAETPVTAGLHSTPPLFGYVATTTKPTADTLLEIGDETDPLLATWRSGLGRVTAWTSDASVRWSAAWASWEGYRDFWAAVVKDAFPLGGATGAEVRAEIVGDEVRVVAEREDPWPGGTQATARVARPDGTNATVALERTAPTTFTGHLDATAAGTYAVGVEISREGDAVAAMTAIASRSYDAEYRPEAGSPGTLERLSERTGGRGTITAADAFDPDGLPAGRARLALAGLLLVLAALLWPVDVALRRLALSQAAPPARNAAGRTLRRLRFRLRPDTTPRPGDDAPSRGETSPRPAPPTTVGRLLERKRGTRPQGDGPPQ